MDGSLNDYLRIAADYLQPSLISREALEHIQKIGSFLPAVSASGFECRLGDVEPRADLGVRFWAPERGSDYLAGSSGGRNALPAVLMQAEPWQRIQAFAAHWARPDTLMHRELEDIFLEFDVEGAPPQVPIPAFFLDFTRGANNRLEILEQSIALLWRESLGADVQRQLRRCLESLPDGAVLYSVGAMFSRVFQGVRLYFHHISSEDMPDYLQGVGWPGSTAAIAELLAWMPPDLTLCVDVGKTLLPKVGFQYSINENLKHSTPMWLEFLDLLVEKGLCVPAKRDGVAAWLGHVHERSYGDRWPANLRALSEHLGPRVMSVFLRLINHVKVSYQPDRPLEAKIYLGMVQTWLSYHPDQRRYLLGDLPEELQTHAQASV